MTMTTTPPEIPITALDGMRPEYAADYASRVADFFVPERRFEPYFNLLSINRGQRILAIDNYDHSLQCATRAVRAEADDETVVLALLHDIADDFEHGVHHGALAALMLGPFMSDEAIWLLYRHVEFQSYHRPLFDPARRNTRERFRGHPAFERTARFCAEIDAPSFDPDYDNLPLAAFVATARRVFEREPRRRPVTIDIGGLLG